MTAKFSSDFFADSSQRFFVSRFLDSPLIIDALGEEVYQATHPGYVTPVVSHLRGMIRLAIMEYFPDITDLNLHRSPLPSDIHVRLLSPSQSARVARSVPSIGRSLDESIAVATAYAEIISDCSKLLGVDAPVTFDISQTSKDFFLQEEYYERAQRELVGKRAAGSRSTVRCECSSIISDYLVLSDKYALWVDTATRMIVVGTYDQYLATLDIIRHSARASLAADNLYPDGRFIDRLKQQWNWQIRWLDLYDNEGFALAKQTEMLAKASLAAMADPVFGPEGPLKKAWEKLKEKVLKLSADKDNGLRIFETAKAHYEEYTRDADKSTLCDLFGCQKFVGHPLIYVMRGGRAVAKEALSPKYLTWRACTDLRAAWASRFVAGYIAKEHKWPTLYFPEGREHTDLYKWYSCNYLNLSPSMFNYADWDGVIFGHVFDFDYYENYLELIDDKSISFHRDELDRYWNEKAPASTSRRLLLEIISRQGFTYKAVVDMVEEKNVPARFRVVALYPKEREMKPDARMFAIMVLEMRMLFAGLEANIAEKIFPYITSQTMTKSRQEIQTLFYRVTQSNESDDIIHVNMECDLSKWNSNWRYQTVGLIGRDLNDLFAMKEAFTFVHPFFQSALIFVRTKKLRPDDIETGNPKLSDIAWVNHLGGFEGIAQKLWTLATYAMMDMGMRHLNCSYILIGQGDNQILSVYADRDHRLRLYDQFKSLVETLLDSLQDACTKVGQNLNPDECLEMRKLITYSKDIWYDGVQFFTPIKFMSKILARSSENIPLLCPELTALSSSALAAAEVCHRPLIVAPIASFLFSLELHRRSFETHPEWSRVSHETRQRLQEHASADILKLLWFPSYLGGLSFATYADYVHGGCADPLAEQIACLRLGCCVSTYLSPLQRLVNSDKIYQTELTPERLLEDPYCLPTKEHPSCSVALEQMVHKYLDRNCKNDDLRITFDRECLEYYDSLRMTLLSMVPFYPVIARDILDASALGEARKLAKMFVKTQTIQLASRRAGYDATDRIVSSSGAELESICQLVWSVPSRAEVCPLSYRDDAWMVKKLRRRWEAIDVYPSGVSAISPFDSRIVISRVPTTVSAIKLYGILPPDPIHSRGTCNPYLGSPTSIERSKHGFRLIGTSRPAKALRRLQTIRSIPDLDPSITTLIDQIAVSRCERITSLGKLQGGVISSNVEHRYQGRETNRGSHTIAYGNLATHLLFSSDEIDRLSGTRDDFPIMFQEWYTMLLGMAGEYAHSSSFVPGYVEFALYVPTNQLTPLPSFTSALYERMTTPVPGALRRSRLIQDPTVWRLEHDGPQPVKDVLFLEELDDQPIEPVLLSALTAVIAQSGYPLGGSIGVLDGVMYKREMLSLDLIEIMCLQASRIVSAVGMYIGLEIGHRFISELLGGFGLGRVEVYLHRLCTDFSRTLYITFKNPLLAADPLIRKLGYSARLAQSPEFSHPTALLYTLIRKTSLRFMYSKRSQYPPVYVFQSERTGRSAEVMVGYLGLVLLQADYYGCSWFTIEQASKVGKLAEAIRSPKMSVKHRLLARTALIWRRFYPLGKTAIQLLDHLTSVMAIVLLRSDHREVIRSARMLSISDHRYVETSPTITNLFTSSTETTNCTCTYCGQICTDTSDKHSRIVRGTSLISDGLTSHKLSWNAILALYRTSRLILIGVGHGIAVREALDLGYDRVVGLDLLSAYSVSDIRQQLPPLAVSAHPKSAKFRWSSDMFRYMKGWREQRLRKEQYAALSVGDLLVIDTRPEMGLEEILDGIEHACNGISVLVRHRCKLTEGYVVETAARRMKTFVHIHWFGSNYGLVGFSLHTPRGGVEQRSSPRDFGCLNISNRVIRLYPTTSTKQSMWADFKSVIVLAMGGDNLKVFSFSDKQRNIVTLLGRVLTSHSYRDWTLELARLYTCTLVTSEGIKLDEVLIALDSETVTIPRDNCDPLVIQVSTHLITLLVKILLPLHWYQSNMNRMYMSIL